MITFDMLKDMAQAAHEADMAANAAEDTCYRLKVALIRAKDSLERATSQATLQAMQAGAIDGKNAETRKVQLDAFLEQDKTLAEWRHTIRMHEDSLVAAEARAGATRAEARFRHSLFDAALASMKASQGQGDKVIELDEVA